MEPLHILDTIQVISQVLTLETTAFDEHAGPITQSVWTAGELKAIKTQLRGLLSLIPAADHFHKPNSQD